MINTYVVDLLDHKAISNTSNVVDLFEYYPPSLTAYPELNQEQVLFKRGD